jgi:MYXO-CTERM domain-containing protein
VDLPARNPRLQALIVRYDLEFRPWLSVEESQVAALSERARARSGRIQPDLLAWVIARPREGVDLDQVSAELVAAGIEEVAPYFERVPPPGDLEPATPDFTSRQGYLDPTAGVNARAAWAWGVTGEGVRLSDCEYGWHPDHEDLMDGDLEVEEGLTIEPQVAARGWDDHGTAVAGEIFGQHNVYGVSGIAPDVTFAFYSEWTVERGYDRGRSIFQAIADSEPGDVVLLEMQTGGPDGRLAPAEVDPAVWSLVKTGTDAGVIVVGAAGNGAANLDGTSYESYRARGDSGAIVVGAGSSDTNHSRLGFSTYGARVNLQGWGQNVFTTGYGNHARYGSGDQQTYTGTFSGTSSASPIVAASAALVVEAVGRYRLDPPAPRVVRELLVATGRAGAPGSNIGPLPDLDAALAEVERRYDVLPTVSVVVVGEAFEGNEATVVADGTWLETLAPSWAWEFDGNPVFGNDRARWTPPGDGEWSGSVTLTDSWGRSATRPFTVVARNVRPDQPTLEQVGEAVEGAVFDVRATADDPGGDPLTWQWRVDGVLVEEDGPSLRWQPNQQGELTIQATAVDDAGATSFPQSVLVSVKNAPPSVTIVGPSSVERRALSVWAAQVEDPGDDTWTTRWEFGDGTVAHGPAVGHAFREPGTYTLRLTVSDGVDEVSAVTEVQVGRAGCGCTTTSPGGWWWLVGIAAGLGVSRRRYGPG